MKYSSNQQFPFDHQRTATSAGRKATRRLAVSRHTPTRRRRFPVLSWLSGILLLILAVGIVFLATGGWKGLAGWLSPGGTSRITASQTDQGLTPTAGITAAATPTSSPSPTPAATPTPAAAPDIQITLAAVGDIILHQAVIDGGLANAGSQPAVYDYRPIFQYVQPILKTADLALANYEGTLAGAPYSGYPLFCAPDAIADALAAAGIRAVWTANNHTIDKGLSGVIRTAATFREKGFQVIGTRPDESTAADAVVDIRGIKLGLMAYTFETIGTTSQKALNGILMPAAADPLIDSFNPYRTEALAKDLQTLLARAAALREQGAELICLSLHWGDEYKTRSNTYQRKMAQQLADAGIELIIGHHPHVLEEIDVLTSAKTGRPALVFYSIGNFLHNMDFDTHGTAGNAQDAVIARIYLLKNTEGVHC